jgi:hypothetical protein
MEHFRRQEIVSTTPPKQQNVPLSDAKFSKTIWRALCDARYLLGAACWREIDQLTIARKQAKQA